jgi:hypothetical protein
MTKSETKKVAETPKTTIFVTPPNYKIVRAKIIGTAPFVSNNFSAEAAEQMKIEMEKGDQGKSAKGPKKPKDFEAGYHGSMHMSTEEWPGIPATSFRAAMIRACSMVKIPMTIARLAFFIMADGDELHNGKPLVKITKGDPKRFDAYVRNDNGKIDIRARALWEPGWEAYVTIKYDADYASQETVINILARAGMTVGVGAGRPSSTNSAGQGWGTFEIKEVGTFNKPLK